MKLRMTSRQWLVTVGLLALVSAAIVGSVLTRESAAPEPPRNSKTAVHRTPLVDERPLQTAQTVAKLASGWDQQRFASQVLRIADNEVDLAFEDALRDAADNPVAPTAETRELYAHVTAGEADVSADQDLINRLKKQLAAATGGHQDTLQQQLDVAQAQLGLDQDELDDAKEDLARSGADPLSRIQRQLKRHEDSEHSADASHPQATPQTAPQAAANNPPANYAAGNLVALFTTWQAFHDKAGQLQRAREEAAQNAATFTQAHAALDKQVSAEKITRQTTPPAAGQPNSNSAVVPASNASSAITTLHRLSDDQKNLSDLDKRIQDETELQTNYDSWIALVQSHQRAAVHGMILSALWILIIILVGYFTNRLIDHYLAEQGSERTRLHTLRVVIRSTAQTVALLLILLVIFGAPQQMPTIIGLAGAGLTVALKDFIVAFFGWFVLMGKNGLRVGDWVEIDGVVGEVIEINLMRTVLLETGNWTDTGHPTGRKVAFMNGYAIEGHFFNFTTSGQWLWDELQIMVPSDQDPYPLLDAIGKKVTDETNANAQAAEKEWQSSTSHYKVRSVSAAPAVDLRPVSSGVEVHVRYITRAQERSAMRARLNHALMELLHHRAETDKQNAPASK